MNDTIELLDRITTLLEKIAQNIDVITTLEKRVKGLETERMPFATWLREMNAKDPQALTVAGTAKDESSSQQP